MHPTSRQEAIMELARTSGRVTVDALAERLDVTPQTIRRDLNTLCRGRMLARVHGGAVLPSGTENMRYEQRRGIAAEAKAVIGQAAAALIPDKASLFINIGTTTEAVSEALLDHQGLMVVTNNINVANRLRLHPTFEVVVSGGVVRAADGGIVGEAAVEFIRQFKVDFAIIGASAIDDDGALLDFDFREVQVARAIIDNARHVVLVADSTKFERTAPVRIGHLRQVRTLVTNGEAPGAIRKICADEEVRLIEVEGCEEY